MNDETHPHWIHRARANGWESPLRVTLDVLEPLGPLGAQVLWVLQPTLGAFVGRDVLGELANAMEKPDGIAQLRRLLDEPDHPPDNPAGCDPL